MFDVESLHPNVPIDYTSQIHIEFEGNRRTEMEEQEGK